MKQRKSIGGKKQYLLSIGILTFDYLFFLLIGLLGLVNLVAPNSAIAADRMINCDAHKGVCSQSLGELTISLEITPRPVEAMQDLVFTVSIEGAAPAKPPHIDLGMPAMKMGPNQVALKSKGNGTYEGTGVIVRCKSGKRTWFANVIIPEAGEVKFIFDVIY